MRNKRLNLLLSGMFFIFFIFTCGGGGGKSNNSTPTPNIYVDQTNIDFAGTVLNSSEDRTITIKNTGNANLKINQILLPDLQFKINDDKCSNTTLAPGQSSSITVRFSPTTVGQSSKIFSIPSNDPNAPTVNVALKGEGCGLNVQINPTFTLNCPNISLNVTVTDQDGQLITDLSAADDFDIYINNSELASVVEENYDRKPMSLVLIMDYSSSLTANLTSIETAAQNFINNHLTDADEAAICKFKAEIGFSPSTDPLLITTDDEGKEALIDYIKTVFSATDGTALFDAIYYSVERALLHRHINKSAIILLSDGDNNAGDYVQDDAIQYAFDNGIPIFSIYYTGISGKPGIMQQIADDTEGKYYTTETGNTAGLEDLFQQIVNVLTDKYTVIIPGVNCAAGSIEIEVRATSGGLSGVDKRTIVLP